MKPPLALLKAGLAIPALQSLRQQGQPGLHNEITSQKTNKHMRK
jgi:hypothetical protein